MYPEDKITTALKNFFRGNVWNLPSIIITTALIISALLNAILTNSWQGFFFQTVAIGWSLFLASYAFIIHGAYGSAENPEMNLTGYGKIRWARRIHQFILNFLGAGVGWIIIYAFTQGLLSSASMTEKIILSVIAFISLTGYLPYTMIIKNWIPGK